MINKISKGKLLPYPEQRPDFVPQKSTSPVQDQAWTSSATANGLHSSRLSEPNSTTSSASESHVNSQQGEMQPQQGSQSKTAMVEAGQSTHSTRTKNNRAVKFPDNMHDDTIPTSSIGTVPTTRTTRKTGPCHAKLSSPVSSACSPSRIHGFCDYTPGLQLFSTYFGIGLVPATLGLTLFVLGYGLGPMIGFSSISEIPAFGRSCLTFSPYSSS
ncbi:uncharacterized protein UTRI_02286 [Ustilago trichophora]|uniref:Uncharacterized protein n=1 Tax=Ustilago trichophora TaxID=86804 RepID=A0A5C3E656_9BASI|nr:uncharacterized protein UTRI_02286 [Ustilago trichophora]